MVDGYDTVWTKHYVPVTGTIRLSGDVPTTLTVPTRKDMVFSVLHDPPGGSSSASWVENSVMTFGVSLSNTTAQSYMRNHKATAGGGINVKLATVVSPLGFGIDTGTIGGGVTWSRTWDMNPGENPDFQQNVQYNKGYTISLTLGKSISTSSDPGTAGRASDLILAGGLELLFIEVLDVYADYNKDGNVNSQPPYVNSLCIKSRTSTQWMPSAMTTFLYSVQEIIDQQNRILAKQRALNQSTNENTNATHNQQQAKYLQQKYQDWDSVLTQYDQSRVDSFAHDHAQEMIAELQEAEKGIKDQTDLDRTDGQGVFANKDVRRDDSSTNVTVDDVRSHPSIEMDGEYSGASINRQGDIHSLDGRSLSWYDLNASLKAGIYDTHRRYAQLKDICARELGGYTTSPVSEAGPYHVEHPPSPHDDLQNECDGLASYQTFAGLFDKGGMVPEGLDGDIPRWQSPNSTQREPSLDGFTQNEFAALGGPREVKDDEKTTPNYISFAGGGASLSFTQSVSLTANFDMSIDSTSNTGISSNDDFGSDTTITIVNAKYNSEYARSNGDSASDDAGQSNSKGYSATVSYTLGDPDVKDKFIVKIETNAAYGTPVFYTLAGASKCPWEPNTTPREAGLAIKKIEAMCGKGGSKGDCVSLAPETGALFRMDISIDYQNCNSFNEEGRCTDKTETNSYQLALLDKWDTKGMIVMVDGVVLGKETLPLVAMASGDYSMYIQLFKGPADYRWTNFGLQVVSACEWSMGSSRCIMWSENAIVSASANSSTPPPTPEGWISTGRYSGCGEVISSSFQIDSISWCEPDPDRPFRCMDSQSQSQATSGAARNLQQPMHSAAAHGLSLSEDIRQPFVPSAGRATLEHQVGELTKAVQVMQATMLVSVGFIGFVLYRQQQQLLDRTVAPTTYDSSCHISPSEILPLKNY
jgi:hypothetical protein